MFIDRDGREIDFTKWLALIQDRYYSEILGETIGDYRVTLCWIPLASRQMQHWEMTVMHSPSRRVMQLYRFDSPAEAKGIYHDTVKQMWELHDQCAEPSKRFERLDI